MLKLIVFDCDGVMFDSKRANIEYYNSLLAQFDLPQMSEEEEHYVHMASVTDSIAYIFRNHDSPSLEDVHSYRMSLTYAPFLEYMTMEPDLVEFLDTVKNKYHLAISTNRTNTMIPLLETYRLKDYFGKVVTAATAKRPKPAPDGLLDILTHFNCRPKETIFIGDSIADAGQTEACGVELIAFKNKDLNAQYHVTNFMDILTLPPFADRKKEQ